MYLHRPRFNRWVKVMKLKYLVTFDVPEKLREAARSSLSIVESFAGDKVSIVEIPEPSEYPHFLMINSALYQCEACIQTAVGINEVKHLVWCPHFGRVL